MIELNITKKLSGSINNMSLDIELNIQNNTFLAITGASGSGKTTLLRILAGLETTNGTIKVDGTIWNSKNIILPPQKRDIGFVFQEYALFTNMTILENLLYVNNDKILAKHLLDITELSSLQNRYPNDLSGGQKQRVALCRALMGKPKILLLDEPLSALDPSMRKKLQEEILLLHKEFNTTTIMVTHDYNEIYNLSNRTIVINNGTIVEDGESKKIIKKLIDFL